MPRVHEATFLRVFLSSPGDVADERGIARKVIARLPKEAQFRERVELEEVSWDAEGLEAPLTAQLTPQEAINACRPKPSQCDVVLVILWARMGTPLPANYLKANGTRYESGTEWEYLDAIAAAEKSGVPHVLVYRRTEDVWLNADDRDFDDQVEQRRRVQAFFAAFRNGDGSLRRTCHTYPTPSAFEALLESHLREIMWSSLERANGGRAETHVAGSRQDHVEESAIWTESPYPGLRAFLASEAAIFFGRGQETDELVARFARDDRRFLAVIGTSGSGKSSLVAAGLLPRLEAGAIGGRAFKTVRFTPGQIGEDPFLALASELAHTFQQADFRPVELRDRLATPDGLEPVVQEALSRSPASTEIVLFIDQFEELFTLTAEPLRAAFIQLVARAATTPRVRTVMTLRADFYSHCTQWESLLHLLRANGSYPIGLPGAASRVEMIVRPATAAGLKFDPHPGLVDRILNDTGTGAGALALMEFLLSKLYDARDGQSLTEKAYESLGGVGGVLKARAEEAICEPDGSLVDEARLSAVFSALLTVDPDLGRAVRKRTALDRLGDVRPLVDRLIQARLVVAGGAEGQSGMVEFAHEAVLLHWPRLVRWLEERWGLLLWQRRIQVDVADWKRTNEDPGVLLRGARLTEAERWIAARPAELSKDETEYVKASIIARDREHAALVSARRAAQMRRTLFGIGMIVASIFATYLGLLPSTRAFVYAKFRPSIAQAVHYGMVVAVIGFLVLGIYVGLPALVRGLRLLSGTQSLQPPGDRRERATYAAIALLVGIAFWWTAVPAVPNIDNILRDEIPRWTDVIVHAQLPNGGFSEHPKHPNPQVWVTAQSLIAIMSQNDPTLLTAEALRNAFEYIELAKVENLTLKDGASAIVAGIDDENIREILRKLPIHPTSMAMVVNNLPLSGDQGVRGKVIQELQTHKTDLYETNANGGGWGYFEQFPWAATEVVGWVAVATARSLRTNAVGIWSPEKRSRMVNSLADTIRLLRRRRLADTGGYSPVPDVGSYSFAQTYATALVLWAITESFKITPSLWSDAEKTELEAELKAGVQWLDAIANPDGWRLRPTSPTDEPPFPGVTMQILCVLGELPRGTIGASDRIAGVKGYILEHGGELVSKDMDDNKRMADSDRYYEHTAYTSEGSTFLWYPWSLCAFGALASDETLTQEQRKDAAGLRDLLLWRAHEFGTFSTDKFLYVPAEGAIGVAMAREPRLTR